MGNNKRGRRGQSGIIGMVILIGLVLTGAMLVLMTGSTVIGELQQDRADTSSQVVMEGVDSELSTLTSSEYSARDRFSLGELERNDARLVRDGYLNVTVNRNGTCATEISLSSIRYENDDGETVAYEAGGVWVGNDGGSAIQTPPDVKYRNGTLDISVTNLTGDVSADTNRAFYNATTSKRESTARSRQVITGTCARPDNVTLKVQSDFYRGWSAHLEAEIGTETQVYPSNRTVVAYLNQSQLPRRVDDSRNNVINTSNAAYMDDVEIDGNTIRVTKNVSNDYRVYVETLSKNRIDIGQVRRIENAQNVTGEPLDVILIFDESGSMNWEADGDSDRDWCGYPSGSCVTKSDKAKDAGQAFVGQLNETRDRIGIVGFNSQARHILADGHYLTGDFTAANQTIENDVRDSGSTQYGDGLYNMTLTAHLKSNQTRQKIAILLSDGQNTVPGKDPDRQSRIAGQQGVTIYTVGFGNADNSSLQQIARNTGGSWYYANNASELTEIFQNIATRISSTKQIARLPTSTSLQTGSDRTYAPQIAGDTDGLAVNTTGGTRYLNINDPTAPTLFSHAFALPDNESLSFNASTYDCAEWRGTGITRSHNGSSYQVTRCTNMTTQDVSIGSDDATVFRDGDDMSSFFSGDDPAWWQENITDAIDSRSDVHLNATSNVVHMKSNQALVVLDYPDGTNSTNRLALLYQIGLAESEARPEGVINIRVDNVEVDS